MLTAAYYPCRCYGSIGDQIDWSSPCRNERQAARLILARYQSEPTTEACAWYPSVFRRFVRGQHPKFLRR